MLKVSFARDVGFGLPTGRELTWTLEKAMMAGGAAYQTL